MSRNNYLYNESDSIDISATGEKLKLDTKDRPHVSVILYHADNDASYVVESSWDDRVANEDWHTLSDQDTTSSFRFQGTVPERYVRLRVDGSVGAGNSSDASIQAVGE